MDIDFSKLYALDESEDWLDCMDKDLSGNLESNIALNDVSKVEFTDSDYKPWDVPYESVKTDQIEKREEEFPYSYDEKYPESIKVAMYLQTDNCRSYFGLKRAIAAVKKSDADILVFPETCYIPFRESVRYRSIFSERDRLFVFEKCLEFSRELGRAVVISTDDNQKIPYSVFANARADVDNGEQRCVLYAKHTMADNSAFDAKNYAEYAKSAFEIIKFRGFKIGLSICYDCNHAAFSRMYGIKGIDLMLNSTGGNVVWAKWYRYNKARAVENSFYNLVTMGNNGFGNSGVSCVFGFNSNGGELKPVNLCGPSDILDCRGGIYVYEVRHSSGSGSVEEGFNQRESFNKFSSFEVPVGHIDELLKQAELIKPNLYRVKTPDRNVILCVLEDEDILKAEKVLPLLYAKELKKISQKRYIIINKFKKLDRKFFAEKLSIVLKVRSMENFCAVVLESDIANKCYQCSKSKNSQTVRATGNKFLIDLSRTTGPEAIWHNKMLMKAKWRQGYEHLIEVLERD